MKPFPLFCVVTGMLIQLPIAQAKAPEVDAEILAQRGKGIVTQEMFAARADKIPADVRYEALRNGKRFTDLINALLRDAQLVAEAREAGFDKQPMVVSRMKLAAEKELAEAWLRYYLEKQPDADYEQLAREYFMSHPDEFMEPEKVDVSHILVSTQEREEPEARELVNAIHQQLLQDPSLFDELVVEYSEDPSAVSNQGKFTEVKKGDMVKPFEDTAFLLGKGEISTPVRTQFGFHIIRTDDHTERKSMSFETVKLQLIIKARKLHQNRFKKSYLVSLNSMEMQMTEEAMREMLERVFGEEYVIKQAGDEVDSE